MDLNLKGKAALVGASSKGIGKAVALRLLEEGAKVVICARHSDELEKAAKELKRKTAGEIFALTADVTNPDDVRKLVSQAVKKLGRLDVLITNCGGPPAMSFQHATDSDWKSALDQNLMSAVRLCRESIPHLKKSPAGSIVNLVSLTVKEPVPQLILSTSARLGVIGMAKYLAGELASSGVRVNSVLPGYTLTNRVKDLVQQRAKSEKKTPEEIMAQLTAEIPLGRMARPTEIADAVVFLASERASFITGACLLVDGGMTHTPL